MSSDIEALKQVIKQNDGIDVLISTNGKTFNTFFASYMGFDSDDGDNSIDYSFSHNSINCSLRDVVGWCCMPTLEIIT